MNNVFSNGFEQFESEMGVNGLVRESFGKLEILAIETSKKGSGQLRQFINKAQTQYSSIYFLEILNPDMEIILDKFGFKKGKTKVDGTETEMLFWTKTSK